MDDHRFDALSKAIATRKTRRSVLKGGMAAAAAGVASFLRLGASAEPLPKVTICHHTHSETNPLVLITVSENSVSLQAHLSHGDYIVDVANDPDNCGDCGVVCEDAEDQCFVRACVEGECTVVPNPGATCDDDDACTENDVCDDAGNCAGTAVNCDDGNACTTDRCDPAVGCVYETVVCDDGDLCTVDTCDPDEGCVSTPVDCDDGDACTNDRCDPATGACINEPVLCPRDETCCGGACVNLASDEANCGACGTVCGSDQECCEGFCILAGTCAGICNTPINCVGGEFQLCGPADLGCICGLTVEGDFGCGPNSLCSDLTIPCASDDECVAVYGPAAFCEAAGTGCCGQVCVPPCGTSPFGFTSVCGERWPDPGIARLTTRMH